MPKRRSQNFRAAFSLGIVLPVAIFTEMSSNSPDLSRLNAAEREALRLLASGHTAKSIAALTGRSEGAVHERLRDARRKSGVSSSRELARIFRDQENRDEGIGVDSYAMPEAGGELPAGGRDRRFSRIVAMFAILATTSVISFSVFSALSPLQTVSPPADPLTDQIVGSPGITPPALRQRLQNESRDLEWAPRSERALTAAYSKIGGLAGEVRIRCGSTLCEVAGKSNIGSPSSLNRIMQTLQGNNLIKELDAAGLRSVSQGFGDPEKSRVAFVAYWSRTASR
jgi:DNA-binding CsgD family transcriptional regulator